MNLTEMTDAELECETAVAFMDYQYINGFEDGEPYSLCYPKDKAKEWVAKFPRCTLATTPHSPPIGAEPLGFHPCKNMNDAMQLADAADLFGSTRSVTLSRSSIGWYVIDISEVDPAGWKLLAKADTAARAITEACLLATEGK